MKDRLEKLAIVISVFSLSLVLIGATILQSLPFIIGLGAMIAYRLKRNDWFCIAVLAISLIMFLVNLAGMLSGDTLYLWDMAYWAFVFAVYFFFVPRR